MDEKQQLEKDVAIVLKQLGPHSEAEAATVRRRLAGGVGTHLIVDEINDKRDLEARLDDLVVQLSDILNELHDDEYRQAIVAVKAGKAVQAVVNDLKQVVAARQKHRMTGSSGSDNKM